MHFVSRCIVATKQSVYLPAASIHMHNATDVFLRVTKAGLLYKAGQILKLGDRIKLTENIGGLCANAMLAGFDQ